MDNLLTKPVNQFTSEEKNQLIAALNSKKPSVQFSCTSLDDCSREDGLNLDLRHIVNTQMLPTFHFPNDISSLAPSDLLCQTLERISRVWVMNNEKSRRIIIDAILSEVLDNECNEKLHGYCEVKNDWNGVAYTGNVDYMFGSSPNFSVQSMDAFLLIVEAKYEWPALAVPQVLAEAGCLLKKRMASGKDTPVFAVLTNGSLFRFFAIDTDTLVYSSRTVQLERGEDGSFINSSTLKEILRWFNWLMAPIKSVSPRASNAELSNTELQDSLQKLRECFGRKKRPRE